MKHCPVCSASYTDDSLQFCLQDGTPLKFAIDPDADTPTVVLTDRQTIVRNTGTPVIAGPSPKKSGIFLPVLLTIFIMLFISALAVAVWLYLDRNKTVSFQGNNQATPSPSPKATVKPSPTSTPQLLSKDELEKVKDEVEDKLDQWKSLSEARDLQGNLENYADHVDYYRAKNVTRDFIRADKQKASSLYDSIDIDLHDVNVILDSGGEKATATFDKEWKFTGPNSYSAGKVQQQLKLEKIDGKWLITSEKDLKLYYKN